MAGSSSSSTAAPSQSQQQDEAQKQQQQEQQEQQPAPLWHGLVAGAASGLAARIVTYPADTVKARLQVQGAAAEAIAARHNRPPGATPGGGGGGGPRYTGTLDAARTMLLREGPPSLYRGFGAVLLGVLPANVAYFGGYELGKRVVPREWGAAADAATGAVAQLLAGVVYTPVDIIKERMQVQAIMGGAYKYAGPLHALRSLLAEGGAAERGGGSGSNGSSSSGGGGGGGSNGSGNGSSAGSGPPRPRRLAGLFRGYWATNAVWLPWNVIYIAAYERARKEAAVVHGVARPEQLPGWSVAACSAAAAGAAAVVTHPGDVVKTRLQVLTATQEGRGLTAVAVARRMWATEGAAAFWSGLGARLLNIAPGCALSWALYEQIKGWLAEGGCAG